MKTGETANDEGTKKRGHESFVAIRNTLYLTSSKAFIAFIIAVLTFFSASQFLDVICLYTEEKPYVVNSFLQGPRFNYQESEPFKDEVKTALTHILDYTLKYQDPDGFKSPDTIRYYVEDSTKNCEKQIKTVLEILAYETENNSVEEKYFENGFASKNPDGTFTINNDKITSYYKKQYDELIESYKRIDEGYSEAASYIEKLNKVYYAVFDAEKERLVSNAPVSTREQAQKYFSSLENCLMVFDSKSPYYVPGPLQDLFPIVQELGGEYEQSFDIYISFSGGLVFNDKCKSIESKYESVFATVAKHSILGAVFAAVGLVLVILLLFLSGRREYRGAPKYALSDKLPNILHVSVHLLIAGSMFYLVEDSIYIILNPHLNTSWLTIEPDYFRLRAEVCSAIFVLFTLAAICCIKRHYLHKTLLTNTLVYKLFQSIKNKKHK